MFGEFTLLELPLLKELLLWLQRGWVMSSMELCLVPFLPDILVTLVVVVVGGHFQVLKAPGLT